MNSNPYAIADHSIYYSSFALRISDKRKCVGWGDPHFETFDGPVFHYMGTGEFRMCERTSTCTTVQDFELLTFHKTFSNPKVSYIMYITFNSYYNNVKTSVKVMQKLQMKVSRTSSDAIGRSR